MTFATAIKSFVEGNMDTYPHSDVPHTRRGFHPKWLLTMSGNKDGICGRRYGYYVIKASCLNNENIQSLMMDGDAIPLPADFCEVFDTLETWGVNKYTLWLQKALFVMHEYVVEDNMYANVAPNKMKLFYDCILPMVGHKTSQFFATNGASYNRVLIQWITYFWIRCRETYSFETLARNSWWFVDGAIDSINREVTTPVNTSVAAAHVVPESPLSQTK